MTNYEDVLELAEEVVKELITRRLTIAIGESCTGGLVASFITDLNGSSEVFQTGIVAYSDEAKEEFLGVPDYVIQNFGAISFECAKLMAEGATQYDVDIGIATTGVIGESIEGKLKGTVFIAVAVSNQKSFARELKLDPKKTRYELKLEITFQTFKTLLEVIDEVY
jgi:nicotinamide-nucleotide amidase